MKKNTSLEKYFNSNLLHYVYVLVKRYILLNIFLKKKRNFQISQTWFKKTVNLIKCHKFNYNSLKKTPSSIKAIDHNTLKRKIIEISFLLLLIPYFPQAYNNSLELSNLVRLSFKIFI